MSRVSGALVLVAVAAGAACGRGSNANPPLELARRYARGDGVPRDFVKAATILDKRCAGGRGDANACGELIRAVNDARGVSADRDVSGLFDVACRGEFWLACDPLDEDAATRACGRGRADACLALAQEPFGGRTDDDRARLRDRACTGDLVDACVDVLTFSPDRRSESVRIAVQHLTAACGRGDVDACAAVERPIDPHALCDAGDYRSCALVGTAGNDAALQLACTNAVSEACELVAVRARDADPPDPLAADKLARACRLGSEVACRHDRPADVVTGCVAYQPSVLAVADRTKLPRLSGSGAGGAPWSAAPDRAYVLLANGREVPWSRYDDLARRLAGVAAVYVIVGEGETIPSDGAAIGFVPDPMLRDEQVTRTVRVVDGWIKVVDRAGAIRAVLATEFPFVPATLARCVHHLLTP